MSTRSSIRLLNLIMFGCVALYATLTCSAHAIGQMSCEDCSQRAQPQVQLLPSPDPYSAYRPDWTTLPSRFTHDEAGNRVDQFAYGVQPVAKVDPTFQSSGYRHYRSSIQAGNSADHYHRVQTWGRPIRPYDEWRFPYRPFSVPYGQWGPPFWNGFGGLPFPIPGINGFGPFGFGPNGFGRVPLQPGLRHPGYAPPGQMPGGGNTNGAGFANTRPTDPTMLPQFVFPQQIGTPGPGNETPAQPWFHGDYPVYGVEPPRTDAEFFNVPRNWQTQ